MKELKSLIKSAQALLDAINANNQPIKGTRGITVKGEKPTGGYVRQQYISEEMEILSDDIRTAKQSIRKKK